MFKCLNAGVSEFAPDRLNTEPQNEASENIADSDKC